MHTQINRIKKEYYSFLHNYNDKTIKISPLNNNYTDFEGYIIGPKNTPYENGIFIIKINLPEQYPFIGPNIIIETKIYHPNIDENGKLCNNIFNKEWSPASSLRTVLISLQSLLNVNNIEIDNLSNKEISNIYINDINTFIKTAKEWTDLYAKKYII